MPISDYLANQLLNAITDSGGYTTPSYLYIGLAEDFVGPEMTGSTITEPSGGGYARVMFNPGPNWASPTAGQLYNDEVITFPQATGSWNTIVNVVVCDASTAGNLLFFGPILPGMTVTSTTPPVSFAVGALVIGMR